MNNWLYITLLLCQVFFKQKKSIATLIGSIINSVGEEKSLILFFSKRKSHIRNLWYNV